MPPRRLLPLAALAAVLGPGAAPAAAQVLPGTATVTTSRLNLRASPGTGRVLAKLARGTVLAVSCQRNGPLAYGGQGASRIWDAVRTPDGRTGWVGDGHVRSDPDALVAPPCGITAPPAPAAGAQSGVCTNVAPVALLPPFPSPEAFVDAAGPAAQASAAASGVPASVTVAQAILETGGGRISARSNNFFGIKAQAVAGAPGTFSWGPGAVGCVLKKTWEVRRRQSAREIGAFRAYASLAASIADHDRLLRANPVYAPAFDHVDDPRAFARSVARRYATDPAYAGKLLSLMDRYDLGRFDA